MGDLRLAETNIALYITGKKKYVLLHHTDTPSKRFEVPLANIDAIDQDRPALDLVKAADQIDDRALACTGRAD